MIPIKINRWRLRVALLNDDISSKIITDHKTGQYSQRKLANKYGVSLGYVNKITKNVIKEDEEVVNAGVAYMSELAKRDEQSVNAIQQVVNEKTKHLQFLHNATLKNVSVMARKLDHTSSISDHKMAQDTIHKAGQTLGVIDQFAKSGDVNVQTNTQINTPLEIKFID